MNDQLQPDLDRWADDGGLIPPCDCHSQAQRLAEAERILRRLVAAWEGREDIYDAVAEARKHLRGKV